MRFKRVTGAIEIILAFLGVGMLLVAVYAYDLKLDNNPTMGSQRKWLALLGLCCLVQAVVGLASNKIRVLGKTDAFRSLNNRFKQAIGWLRRSSTSAWLRSTWRRAQTSTLASLIKHHPKIWAVGGVLLVTLISYWYITSGRWEWISYTRYFDRQADAFLSGSLALLDKPSDQLSALANPYDYHNRAGIKYLWDVSLYQGKFYLYWGPVPAVLAAAVKLIHPGEVQDQYLVMFFVTGLTLVLAALLYWLRKTFFPKAPAWTVLLFTLIGGLSTPMLWLINRPSVYETAIAGGEFFLVLGLYAALRGMLAQPETGRSWLIVAGLAWGAAVGCRVNDAIAVIWLAGLTCLYLILREKRTWKWVFPALCLGVPLLAWAAGLGWYNLARFGSLFETGHRYQLTGPALPAVYSQVVSLQYILPNLYNSLFRPLVYSRNEFPFVFAPNLTDKMWPWFIQLPEHYYSAEPVAGIFLSIPLFWLVALPALAPLRAGWNWLKERSVKPANPVHPLLPWTFWMIAGAVLCNLGSLTIFISSTMRYLADVVPLMTILVGLCVWWGLDFLNRRPGLQRLLLVIVFVLGLVSVLIALFVNFHVSGQRFETNNPHLYRVIAQFFMGKH
jgi:hypothetical protein